jgi:hypothetical protein
VSDADFEILWAERAITRVVLRYARAVDACDFETLRTCFHPDARIHYGDLFSGNLDEAIEWLRDALPRLQSTLHDFGAPWTEVDLAAGTASCESYSTNSARYPPDEKGEVILNVTGTRYLDRFERRDGAWRIVERRNQSVWSLNAPELPTPPPPFQAGSPALR